MSELVDLDLFSPAFQSDPAARFAELRQRAPVAYVPQHGWWVITPAALVREVLTDPQTYSSRVHKHTQPPPEVADEVAAIRAQGWPYTPALGTNDPPDHPRVRRLVQRAFTPRALAWMVPLVRSTAEELAAGLVDGTEVDLLPAFAEPLPVWAISRVLGLPDERRADVRRWSIAATASIGGVPTPEAWVQHERDLLHYQQTMAAEIAAVRANPREGLISTIVEAADNPPDGEERVSTAQLLTLLRELVVAGNETSARIISEIVRLLDRTPGEWERIAAAPDRARAVVEEALRFASPSQTGYRRTTRATTLGGVDLPEGATLVVSFASSNRDGSVFAEPDLFDPDREGLGQHLAFGLGSHACPGNQLARMEAVTATQVLVEQLSSLHVVDPEHLRYSASFMVRGLLELPVRVARR